MYILYIFYAWYRYLASHRYKVYCPRWLQIREKIESHLSILLTIAPTPTTNHQVNNDYPYRDNPN